jgi:hypothetical protein
LNERGESIKGQPDSYVGETAATASVAVCYTVQRARWWKKVVDDVREAVAAAPLATEVVVVIPHNVDRDGPKDESIDWLGEARAISGNAAVRVIDGREISRLLDSDHQDLRHQHLGIPYSRLSGVSVLSGCQVASLATIDSITTSGRYDPARYSQRVADKELYRLWQSAFRHGGDNRVAPVRLIALVNDSGVGKTSLVCEFARTLGSVLPVLLLQARDLAFGAEDKVSGGTQFNWEKVKDQEGFYLRAQDGKYKGWYVDFENEEKKKLKIQYPSSSAEGTFLVRRAFLAIKPGEYSRLMPYNKKRLADWDDVAK